MASLSLRALACTKPSRRSLIRPTSCPRATDCENAWISCPATSLAITPASRRAASRPYSGSSPVSSAAVRIDSSSSSAVVAPSYRPEMVRVATRIGSTACRPSAARVTARTILLRSTASLEPLRLVTRMPVAVGGGVRSKAGAAGAAGATAADSDIVSLHADARSRPVPRRRGWHRKDEGVEAVSHGLRRACGACGRPCCTSHLPPEIPRPAPRVVLRAAVGRSSDSWMRRDPVPATSAAASQGHRPSANRDLVSTYRCGAVPESVLGTWTGFPFHPAVVAAGTDRHNILGVADGVNGFLPVFAQVPVAAGISVRAKEKRAEARFPCAAGLKRPLRRGALAFFHGLHRQADAALLVDFQHLDLDHVAFL